MAYITIIAPTLQVSYEVGVTKDMLLKDLKADLEVLTGLPIGKQRLRPPSSQVFDFEDDMALDIKKIQGYTFHLVEIGTVEVFIHTLTGNIHSCWVSSTATVLSLKHQVEEIEGFQPDEQRLIFAGKQLDYDDHHLSQYNIKENSIIYLVLRLRGGGGGGWLSDVAFAGVRREWDGSMYFDGVTGLSLSFNQVVVITQKIDDHWFRGRLPGKTSGGVFPSTFVEILEFTDRDFMLAQGGSAPLSLTADDTERTWWTLGRKVREEALRGSELMHQSKLLTPRPGLAVPPFRYPMITKPEFKFPLPKSSFIHLSVTSESAIPGSPVNVAVKLSSNTHDSIFVSSIHLTIEAGGSAVLDVRPVFETRSGKHIEMNVQNTTSTQNTRQFSGTVGVSQLVTAEVGATRGWQSGTSLQLGGKEIIPAQVSGQVVGKNAFWNIQSEITPSRLRGFSGPVWDGMLFVLDRHSIKLGYGLTVNCRIQGEAKDRIIKGKCWWRGYR